MNVSLSELLLVFLIALIVVKPEQLPDVAYSIGRFMRSLRGMFDKAKSEMTGLIEPVKGQHEQPSDKTS